MQYTGSDVIEKNINTLIVNYNQIKHATKQHDRQYIGVKQSAIHFCINIQEQSFIIEDEKHQILLINDASNDDNKELNQMKIEFINKMQYLQNGFFSMAKNDEGNIVYTMGFGKLFKEMGLHPSEFYSKTAFDIFPLELAKYKQSYYEKAFQGKRINYEIELNGKQVFVDITPIWQGKEVTEIVASVFDITEFRTIQKELQINQGQFQSLFEYNQDYIITFNTDAQIMNMNQRTCELFGISSEERV